METNGPSTPRVGPNGFPTPGSQAIVRGILNSARDLVFSGPEWPNRPRAPPTDKAVGRKKDYQPVVSDARRRAYRREEKGPNE